MTLFDGQPMEEVEMPRDHHKPPPGQERKAAKLVPRHDGWVLVANRLGVLGFHRIKTVGNLGSLVTQCGVTGRKVEEAQRSIVECVACNEA